MNTLNLKSVFIVTRKVLMAILTILNVLVAIYLIDKYLETFHLSGSLWYVIESNIGQLMLVNLIIGMFLGLYKILPTLANSLLMGSMAIVNIALLALSPTVDFGVVIESTISLFKFIFLFSVSAFLPAAVVWYYKIVD